MTKFPKRRHAIRHKTVHPLVNLLSQTRIQFATGVVVLITAVAVLAILSQPKSLISADFRPQVLGAPSLAVLSDEVVNHGDVPVGQFVETEFVVQNVGDEILHILGNPQIQVVEGCCPSQTTVGSYILEPGQITTIRTRFTMHPGMGGPHDFRVHVRTNDPAQPNKLLTILSNWVS